MAQQPPLPVGVSLGLSLGAAGISEFSTMPLDTAKVRLQLQSQGSTARAHYKGLADCLATMARQEGLPSLWRGVTAGLQRQAVFAPLRLGLYEPVRNFYMGKEAVEAGLLPTLPQKILAGLTTSAIGITVASPADTVKVRLQAQGRAPPEVPRLYSGVLDAYRKIAATEGIRGLWRGYVPNLLRNSLISATELATFDQVKESLLGAGLPNTATTHVMAGLSAGFAATVLGSPIDVVKTRVMNSRTVGGQKEFSGALDCAVKILKNEGVGGFYKGFVPNFARIGGWNTMAFVLLEQFKLRYYASLEKK
ncbi:mitochondrial carrier domain-containing protein [Hyaloraphidium curvatum]|nr:mitochondrial carrier domain-containing protein [Hyaloraphidium curvatum]